jgi:GTP-binding protein
MNKQTILSAYGIVIRSGNGGNGKISFRRERFVPFGGPDGGNGGTGGSVILKCDKKVDYLDIFKSRRHFYAQDGENGRGKMQYGKHGEDLYLYLPLGTEVYDAEDNLIIDLVENGMEYVLAKGGQGGVGNMHLANSIDKAPLRTIPATPGEELIVNFRLKIIADIGLVGFPNAGKSSLINCLTNCKSLVGNYPFTTLTAHLGVFNWKNQPITLVDIPGLVKGASQGKGMGMDFLQNIERCAGLAYVLDGSQDYENQYLQLIHEIQSYDEKILEKPFIIVINKQDLMDSDGENRAMEIMKKYCPDVVVINTNGEYNMNILKTMVGEVMEKSHKNL